MAEITTQEIKEYLKKIQGQTVTLKDIRVEFNILPGSKSFDAIRNIMFQLAEQKVVRTVGSRGEYKVVTPVKPVQIFGTQRERRQPFELVFPRSFSTMEEMDFAKNVVVREGDLITLGGVKSKGKTTLCLQFCAENVSKNPVLMGNEYTTLIEDKESGSVTYEPTSRFLNRLDTMKEWVDWVDDKGMDKFTLLPVRDDYAEHIVKDKINIIDWVNLSGDRLYDIGKLLERIKANIGRGVAIVALQKGAGASAPRGGQFVSDFSDLEILLDGFGQNEDDVLLTIKGCKEKTKPIVGKTYAYTIGGSGTKIFNFREVKKCHVCSGTGFSKGNYCGDCEGKGWTNVGGSEY